MVSTTRPAVPVGLFYSYSHEDEDLRDKLEIHLSLLQDQGVIRDWHDRRIGAGTEWEGAIDENLHDAEIILLLVSADVLASRYCRDVEIRKAMERYEAGAARVIPVILRPVDNWQSAPFGKLQALPKNGKPITTWKNRDEAFADVARGIRNAVMSLGARHQWPSAPTRPSPGVPIPSPGQPLDSISKPDPVAQPDTTQPAAPDPAASQTARGESPAALKTPQPGGAVETRPGPETAAPTVVKEAAVAVPAPAQVGARVTEPAATNLEQPPAVLENSQPPFRVLCPLHGIRTLAAWQRKLSDLAHEHDWACQLDRWFYGRFSILAFLTPWTREAMLGWLRRQYDLEISDRHLHIEEGQVPSVVAHSFGTYILGYTLLRFDFIRFDNVILCGSILPRDFPWDQLIARGQVQAVRNEYGVRDPWVKRVRCFVRGTGPSGAEGFIRPHERLEQEEFDYDHGEYFERDHMEDRWVPFLERPLPHIARSKGDRIPRPKTTPPWCLYVLILFMAIYVIIICLLLTTTHPPPSDGPTVADGRTAANGSASASEPPVMLPLKVPERPPGIRGTPLQLKTNSAIIDNLTGHRLRLWYYPYLGEDEVGKLGSGWRSLDLARFTYGLLARIILW